MSIVDRALEKIFHCIHNNNLMPNWICGRKEDLQIEMLKKFYELGIEFKSKKVSILTQEISSLSIKIYGSLISSLNPEDIDRLSNYVVIDYRVVNQELASFKKLFQGFKEMVSSKERELFLTYVE